MKFMLLTSGYFYDNEKKCKRLEELGFRFELSECSDSKMRYIKKEQDLTIEISTMDQLLEFVKKWGEVVISEDSIEIYDNYRE